jgi:hypothetical protein
MDSSAPCLKNEVVLRQKTRELHGAIRNLQHLLMFAYNFKISGLTSGKTFWSGSKTGPFKNKK